MVLKLQPYQRYMLHGHLVAAEPVGFGWWLLTYSSAADNRALQPMWAVSPKGTIYANSPGADHLSGYPIGSLADLMPMNAPLLAVAHEHRR